MNMFKRMLALALALIMVLSLAACGGTTETKEPAAAPADAPETTQAAEEVVSGEFNPRSVTEGVTLTVAMPMNVIVEDWETNAVTLAIQEALGVELEFEVYASADYSEKLNVMVNGGDKLPDIIMADSGSAANIYGSVTAWANAGALYELTEFFENPDYAVNINKAMARENDQFINRSKDVDGRIWAYPTYLASPRDQIPYNLLINEVFAKAVGFDKLPETTEEFLELARAFKAAGDVNGNGQDDEVVMTGRGDNMRWFNTLMTAFEYAWGANYLVDNNGELHFAYTTDAWKEGLKYIRVLFEEELIDTGALTNDKSAYNSIVNAEGPRALADGYYWVYAGGGNDSNITEEMMQYAKPVMLKSPVKDKIEGHYQPSNPIATGVISADCENPLAAFLVLDYLYSETIAITNRYGQEGVNWDYWENLNESLLPEGKTKDMYVSRNAEMYPTPYVIVYNRLWAGTEAQNVMYSGFGPSYESSAMYYGAAILNVAETEEDQRKIDFDKKDAQHVADAFKVIPEALVTEALLAMSEDELEELSDVKTTLSKYVSESIASFLTGQWDIDADWDTYMAELDKIGIDKALDLYQTAYDRATK